MPPVAERAAFSLIELVVALAAAVAVLTGAVMAFKALTQSGRANSAYADVTIGAPIYENFYGVANTPQVSVPVAPNYGQRAAAERVREAFWDDVNHASAVFCLGRNGRATARPATIAVGAGFQGRLVDTPELFQEVLETQGVVAVGDFVSYRGASAATNLSIFVLQPSSLATELDVRAIYEIDIVPVTLPAPGYYASVRRYVRGDELAELYDVYYRTPETGAGVYAFSPLAVAFEREARLALDEGVAVNRFKVAKERPFYFIWWPDPVETELLGHVADTTQPASDPRFAYAAMGGRTSLFFVVPLFPAL